MNVLIDTGFWFAYYEGTDAHHPEAIKVMELLNNHRILIPFPSLYETIDTRFCRRKEWVNHFNKLITSSRCALINDEQYKESSLTASIESAILKNWPLSLVDMVIRQMLADVNLKTDAIITFNPGDFDDICRKMQIQTISNAQVAEALMLE